MGSTSLRTFSAAAIVFTATFAARAQTWTGLGTDNLWTNSVNWDTAVPVNGNTANFIDAGNGKTSISLGGAAQPIGSVAFDTANAAAYTIGGLATGDQLNFDAGGTISLTTSVVNPQTINASVTAAGGLNITNNGTSTAPLTFGAGIRTDGAIAVSGAGAVTFNGIVADGPNSLASVNNTATGILALNSQSTYSGGTTVNMTAAQGTVRIGANSVGLPGSITSGPFGTGPITLLGSLPAIYYPIGADRTVANDIGTAGTPSGQGMFWASADALTDPTGPHSLAFTGNIYLTGARTFTNNLVGGTLTLGSAASPGTITRNNNLTFQSQAQVQPTGGVMVLNDAIAASTGANGVVTFQNGLKVTVNNTIGGNGSITVQSTAAPNTVAHFNKTDMYLGTGNVNLLNNNATATTGTTVYFDQPNVFGSTLSAFPTTSIVNPTGLGTTVYVNSPLITNHRWDIEGDAVVYFNAPTTFNGTATSAFQVQGANTRKQTAMVINSTLTKGPNAGSGVRVATGTLAGNGGTILSNVSILHSTSAVIGSYLAPGTPAVPGGTNMTPSYQNGPGQLTITFATGNALDFNGTSNCANCNLYAEIGGTTPGTQYDQVVVNGTAAIGTSTNKRAHLAVALINGYTRPAADTDFEIIKATTLSAGLGFIDATLPDANWSVLYGSVAAPNSLVIHVTGTGDFNGDHIVDAADYVSWRKTDGTAGGYDAFRRNFGNTVPGSGSGLGNAAVPEPGSIVLFVMGLMTMVCPRRALYTRNR